MMTETDTRRWQWLAALLVLGFLVWRLAPILTPFVISAMLGWLGDPVRQGQRATGEGGRAKGQTGDRPIPLARDLRLRLRQSLGKAPRGLDKLPYIRLDLIRARKPTQAPGKILPSLVQPFVTILITAFTCPHVKIAASLEVSCHRNRTTPGGAGR